MISSNATLRLSQLSPAKRALLEKRLQKRMADMVEEQTIRPRTNRESPLPLSFAQQRLWFIDQLEPGSSAYNISTALRLGGPLRIDAMERCLNEIVRRHETLRTTFRLNSAQQPVQVIAPQTKLSLRVEDLSALTEGKREAEAIKLASEEAQRPFDLARGPLIRARVLRLAADDHVLLFTMHHIISDGWSMGVLVAEIGALYSAYAQNRESPLRDLPIQYADFAQWQRQWMQGEVLAEQLDYWRRQLAGDLPVLSLPTDYPRPLVQGTNGGHELFDLRTDLSDGLKHLSYREDATLFMTLLAAFQVLLYRYTGQEDFLVGAPTANRSRPETESLIGFFVNTLVLRADLSGNPTFRELVRRVQKMALAAYAHQDLPFERLVEELHPNRDLSRNPLVQVVLALQNTPMGELELHGLRIQPHEFDSDVVRVDLEFHLHELPEGLGGLLVYNADLFEKETIRRFLEHFRILLEGIVTNPDQRISDLLLLTSAERDRLLFSFNETRQDPGPERTIHELFEAQVERRPDSLALEFEDQAISYRELDRRANQLARYLRARGVGPEVRVALLIERSPQQIIALLAVLKAGGAYVPLDAGQPRERLSFMLQDSGAKLLLSCGRLSSELLTDGIELVDLDKKWNEIALESGEQTESGLADDNTAYMIYTSGSTGQPKGVTVSHRSLVNAIVGQFASAPESLAGTILLMSYAFDGSLLSIFCSLCQGASLVLPPEGESADALRVARLIAEHRTTHLWAVPSFYSLLLEQAHPEQLETLRVVHVGGETCRPQLVERHYQLLPQSRLVNVYGPTETTIWATTYECGIADREQLVPIGRPGINMQAYVLDGYLQPVSVGVTGRLYVGGVGIARGYWNRPDLTAERFIPNPYGTESGGRLYRTGDLARHEAEGRLVLLGREDAQVKVRGYRVELGEIEAALCELEWVQSAVVSACESAPGDQRLVAYVVPGEKHRGRATPELRDRLRGKLPEYMVPSSFVFLDELPLTPAGKVDRRALPEPDRDTLKQNFVAPRTPVEERLARIWGEVLKIETIGINDDFFDLGGHSLLATQLISRVRESFAVDLPLRSVFESPTVAGLAGQVETLMKTGGEMSAPPLVPVSRETRRQVRSTRKKQAPPLAPVSHEGALPVSFAQQRLWFMHELEPGGSAYNMPVAVRLKGRLNHPALEQTLSEIVRRHGSLRTTITARDGEICQVIAPPEDTILPVTDLCDLPESERMIEASSLAADDARESFDLSRGPLYRSSLLRLGAEDHILLVTMHHIISDGWGMGVMVREVAELYTAFVEGKPSPLAPLPLQYVDFAHWQRNYLVGETLAAHLQYWKQKLGGTLPVLELQGDRPRHSIQSFRGAGEKLSLSAGLTQRLKARARNEGVTPFMILLAAFKALLYRYTGEEDIIIGSPIANRNRLEVEGLIGFFVNTLVLRTDLSGAPSFRELLDRVRTVALEAYAHQDMPFEKLVEHLQPERSMSRHPLFQVMFQLGNAPMGEASLPGLTLEPVLVEKETTQFDLSLDLVEGEESLWVVAEYSTDLFDSPTIARMLHHFQILLEDAVDNPDRRIGQLSLMTEAECEQLLVRWNNTRKTNLSDQCLPALFEAQVARTPEAVAIIGNGEELSYAALNNRANQLAHYLRSMGVGPEVRVGVLMERSLEMVVALLAVLKAGGAYVPLDPLYPKNRLAFMLEDTQTYALLTQRRLKAVIPEHPSRVVCLDVEAAVIGRQSTLDPTIIGSAENLAYVIYTSGSTGQPKGVGVTHKSLVNHHAAVRNAYGLRAGDRVLQFASLSFDVAAEEIFPTLLTGATVVLHDGEMPGLGRDFVREVKDNGVTVLNLPASAWCEWVDWWADESSQSREELPDCLRLVIVGSERVPEESFAAWRQVASERTRLLNAYGTTETSITATLYSPVMTENEAGAGLAMPIGRPLANTQTYILDRLMQPVPVGIGGELYIGGAGLARGYLNRPDATAEKFIPNPFGDEPGTRLYQTGDLARYLPDGNIEFIRRVDRQVKVRGFRIELGEIEAVLNEHANVRHAVVEASADRSGLNQLVGYVVTEQNQPPAKKELREFLRDRLPEFMVPSVFVMMKELPLTPGGKVDRRALPAPEEARGEAEDLVLPRSQVEHAIAAIWREVLRLEQVGVHENFFDLGGHSLLLVRVHNRLQKALDQDITVLDLFKYPTIRLLAEYIAPEHASLKSHGFQAAARKDQTRPEGSEIAIIGMAGRFPGSKDLEEFWRNLCEGVEAVSFFSDEELIEAGVGPALLNDPNYVKAGVVLDDIDQFDALFFGYSPREAEVMDPQHRLFLECASEALERAGHDSEQSGESVGVFAGTGTGTYVYNLLSNPEIIEAVGGLQLAIGNDKDHLPTHVSYKLNLRGPSIAVQTACSASLVAVHMACRSVLEGECKMALAGGVAVHEMDKRGYLFQEGGIGSPDGHCRAFDADAQGTISGSGVGVVVLKRLQDALADGDFIHAVIKGSAVNNDGSAKVGYTAPSVQGQAEVIRAAQIAAGVDAESITYIEAHGTGTRLGDPIEIAALTQVFRENTNREDFCAVGSLKTNIGHLDTAAGVAGLIKTVLALEHKAIPPSLHFQQPNPALELESSPFYINNSLTEWKSDNGSRRAGVSSFGIGGTNAHVIVEEAPPVGHSSDGRPWHLLMLSAQTDTALNQATANLAAYLEAHPESNLADVAYTMQVGRKTFSHRRVVICHELDDAIRGLELLDPQRVFTVTDQARGRDVVFMFPGQGVQSVNMGRDLYQHEAVFREQVDRCSEMLKSHIGFDLRDVLYPAEEVMEDAAVKLQQTRLTQPALFVIEYALAQLWMKWGVKPRAMIGHSIGEYVAACLAGVFSLADALSLVALRGKLMQSLPEGGMLSVALAEDELRGMLGNQLSIAAVNGPSLSVVSGPDDAVSDLQDRLAAKKVGYRRLLTSHAFHSHMMAPIIAEFTAQVRKVKLNAPQIRYLSNVSGTWISRNDATDPGYWARHLRQTVRFADGARELLRDSDATLLEVGPGQTLSTMIRPLARETGQFVVNSQRHPQEQGSDEEVLMKALGRLWLAGVRIDWRGFYAHEVRHRLPLPTYPFERRSYWVGWQKPAASDGDNQPRKKPDVADWFYLPHWKPSVSPIVKASSAGAEQSPVWLVFPDERGFSKRIAEQLEQRGAEVFMVRGGERFERLDDRSYAINVAHPEDYEALVLDLKSRSKMPNSVLHSLSVTASEQIESGRLFSERLLRDGFYSLMFLAKALGHHELSEEITIAILSDCMQRVTGEDRVVPEKATVLGPCAVIPQEYASLNCRSIDVVLPATNGWQEELLIAQIVSDLRSNSRDAAVAYRGNQRWIQAFEPVKLARVPGVHPRLREEGVYLVTGGLGGLGLALAEHLAQTLRAKLLLVGRSAFPSRDEWAEWLATHPDDNDVSRKIRRLQGIENHGAQVLVASADVCDEDQMREALRVARARFGRINGVIHAAGIAPGRLIETEQYGVAENTLAPKVKGTRVLENLFKEEGLDFFALCSSISSILGVFGQVDYCAANAFLDAFAHYNTLQNGIPTVAINWDTWRDTGMAVNAALHFRLPAAEFPEPENGQARPGDEAQVHGFLRDAISTPEGIDAFDRILAHNLLPQVLVSTRDLQSVIRQTEARTQSLIFDEMMRLQQSGPAHQRPDVQTTYVAPRNELEEKIAAVWQSLLGIEQVGVDDNFFELGGHSLLATQLVSRLREGFRVEIPLRTIFERATVAGLAEHIEQAWLDMASETAAIVPVKRETRQVRRAGN